MIGQPVGWQPFERRAAGYEAWYTTRRGRRADLAERALLERLLAPFAEAQSALEVGCGTGHFTRWLAGRLPHVIGLDRSPAMLAEARRPRPLLLLIQGDAHHLPIRSRAVDLSVFVITLEFVEHPAVALAEAVRVARRGVLVVALNRWSLGGLFAALGCGRPSIAGWPGPRLHVAVPSGSGVRGGGAPAPRAQVGGRLVSGRPGRRGRPDAVWRRHRDRSGVDAVTTVASADDAGPAGLGHASPQA